MSKDKSPAITMLRFFRYLIPGNYLRTTFFVYFVIRLRRAIRLAIGGFYRMEHVYDVLYQCRANYTGKFAILEFGTNEGYALTKMLYAAKYTGMEDRVVVHGFDSFEGMPAPVDQRDRNIILDNEQWVEGQFKGGYEALDDYCRERYSNFELHRGFFEDSLTEEVLEKFRDQLPILVWIDCDYYSSARTVMEKLIPYLPTGCIVYFDEIEFNYGSRFTGEARVVHEINSGVFGDGIELILDTRLTLDSKRVYRFVRFEGGPHFESMRPPERDPGRSPGNDSPLP